MTREFIVRKLETKELALDALKVKFDAYLSENDIPEWKWLVKPEALFGVDGWRAYGRIEWSKK